MDDKLQQITNDILRQNLLNLARALDEAERIGYESSYEGSRYIPVSDVLAKRISELSRAAAEAVPH